jgi:hypothetical protein
MRRDFKNTIAIFKNSDILKIKVRRVKIMTGYCVKCKTKREIKNPKKVTMKNGRSATKGVCPKCGTGMYKIGG